MPSALSKVYGKQIATVSQVRQLLAELPDVKDVNDVLKKIEAARKYDNDTRERQNYWGELAIWAIRELGNHISEAQKEGKLATRGGNNNPNSHDASLTLADIGVTHSKSARAQKILDIDEDTIAEYVAKCQDDESHEATVAGLLRFATPSEPHVAHNSGEQEWYTPPEFIEAARKVMGSIDLDPASSDVANETVGAETYYTADDNGLEQTWHGNVWMNPPYGQPVITEFCAAVVEKFNGKEISQACVLVNNATETAWFQGLLTAACAVCLLRGRIAFLNGEGESTGAPLQGQAFLYFGNRNKRFATTLKDMGVVLNVT